MWPTIIGLFSVVTKGVTIVEEFNVINKNNLKGHGFVLLEKDIGCTQIFCLQILRNKLTYAIYMGWEIILPLEIYCDFTASK